MEWSVAAQVKILRLGGLPDQNYANKDEHESDNPQRR
jgi:hypothetical protein